MENAFAAGWLLTARHRSLPALQVAVFSERGLATEYHLAGPGVLQYEQSGFDSWDRTFDVRHLLGGRIGREFKLQSPAPVVVDFESNNFHVSCIHARICQLTQSPFGQQLSIRQKLTNLLGDVRLRGRTGPTPGKAPLSKSTAAGCHRKGMLMT